MKRVAMIPARMGSKRVANKNLRLIAGKPLIAYIIEAVKNSGKFDKIYINSESDVFEDIAKTYGVHFYKRPEKYATDEATNDDFSYDFMKNVELDVLYQFLPTSPFITSSDVVEFVEKMESGNYETLISVTNVQIECLYKQSPLNFKQKKQSPPSQSLEPVKAYACGMMAWERKRYFENMEKYGCAYHGGDGKTGFFTVGGFASVDIDTVDDFLLAERIIEAINSPYLQEPQYYNPDLHSDVISESDVPYILKEDGVVKDDYEHENQVVTNIDDVLNDEEAGSWMRRIVNTESNSCCLISQNPGEGNRRHYHPNWNEWWYIVDGEWDFELEGTIHRVKKGDIVFIPKNHWHQITCVGDKPAIRLAVSRGDVAHVYKNR